MIRNDIWRHALAYAEKGICVVPLRPLAKAPAIRNWPELATSDPDKIERWSKAHPDANIGIVPGKSELAVFDVDLKSGGLASWTALVNEVGGLDVFDRSPTAKTPSGGFHAYFRKQPALRFETHLGIVHGIDFFSTTGQLVAPPSRLREAGYEWRSGEYVEAAFLTGARHTVAKGARTQDFCRLSCGSYLDVRLLEGHNANPRHDQTHDADEPRR